MYSLTCLKIHVLFFMSCYILLMCIYELKLELLQKMELIPNKLQKIIPLHITQVFYTVGCPLPFSTSHIFFSHKSYYS